MLTDGKVVDGGERLPFEGKSVQRDGMEPAEPRLIAGIAELSGRGHPVGRLGTTPRPAEIM